MPLPTNATVEATPHFLAGLKAAQAFFEQQDMDTAAGRAARLRAGLREMVQILAWSPASGRPARFVFARSAQARLHMEAVHALASQVGLPHLCEYVVGQHLVLYAHSADTVMLLALKHQRAVAYTIDAE